MMFHPLAKLQQPVHRSIVLQEQGVAEWRIEEAEIGSNVRVAG